MDAVTYPDANVVACIAKNVIPLRIAFDSEPYAADFTVKWTPTLVFVDENGKEHHRTVGFLPSDEFIPSILLGVAKTYYELDCFLEALDNLEKIISGFAKSGPAPEAVFLRGVCGYKHTHDPKPLKQAYEKLNTDYKESEWAKRALPYRLLP
jgi:hypothetical protein